jgi:flagellar hook-length control protein FliK
VTEARFAPQMAEATPDIPQTPGTQIVEEAQIQQAMGRSQFTMRLNPESLGQVTVRLTMIGDQLTARIITHTEAAREALATELSTLGDAMRDKGVNVRQVQVIDSSMGQASLLHDGEQRGGQWQQGRRQRHVVVPTVDATEAVAGMELPTLDVATDDVGGVEIRA